MPYSLKLSLVAIQALNILTLVTELSFWFIALSLVCLLWHISIHQQYIAKPSRIIKFFIAITGCILLGVSTNDMGVLIGMIHLLCLSYLLKPFELHKTSDLYQLIVLGLFILASSFIFNQSIYFSVFIIILVTLNIAWWLCYFSYNKNLFIQLRTSFKLLLQSFPLAIVLFVFFPKISPFWHVPMAKSATTGLSDNVSVGDISNLALSNELAFRVEFSNERPNYSQMYWRALVLEDFDGKVWRRIKKSKEDILNKEQLNKNLDFTKQPLNYEVIAEPSYQRWLFSLDVPKLEHVKQNKIVYQLNDQTLFSRDKIAQPLAYKVTSYIDSATDIDLTGEDKHLNIATVESSSPRLVVLAKNLRREYQDNHELIQQVLLNFRQQNYRYTLSPPTLSNNSLDEFYFDTQAGFCEHYASSFTFLMRAVGIPARMVLGYLGGDYNSQGDYYSIYQRDAHAWSEVWLSGVGWVRIDPTAAVDPSRVEQGFSDQLLFEQESLSSGFYFDSYLSAVWLNKFKLQFEALDYQWTKLVINFSQEKQKNLLKSWFGDDFNLKSAIIISITIIMTWMILWLLHLWSKPLNKTQVWIRYYLDVHNKLREMGLIKKNEQLQKQFLEQVLLHDTNLGQCYQRFVESVGHLQYKENTEDEKVELIQIVKQEYRQFCHLVIQIMKQKNK
jgi:transglutaminase-like putative cysteine protease